MSLKQEQHLVLSDVLAVAKDLGRIPSRDEYQNLGKFSKDKIIKEFGSWTHLMHASGLGYSAGKETKSEKQKKSFEHLQQEIKDKRSASNLPLITKNLLVIGDLHAPFHHPDAIDFLIALNRKYKFDLVCSVGDEIDAHSISFHDHDPDLPNAGQELDLAIKSLKPLYQEFPNMIVAESNHGSLFYRKAKYNGMPARAIRSYKEMIEAPDGWEWRFEINLQDNLGRRILVHHSYGGNVLAQSKKRGVSLIQGHHHTRHSIEKWGNRDQNHFAAFTGCLVDDLSLAMAYNKNQVERPLLGCIRVTDGEPHLLPMNLDKNGRWDGKL